MFEDLESGSIDGVIVDESLAIYYGSQFCNLVTLDNVIYQFNYGIMFAPSTNDTLISNISQGIIEILETQQYVFSINHIMNHMLD